MIQATGFERSSGKLILATAMLGNSHSRVSMRDLPNLSNGMTYEVPFRCVIQHVKGDKEVHHYEVLKKIKLHDFFHIPIKFLIHTKET